MTIRKTGCRFCYMPRGFISSAGVLPPMTAGAAKTMGAETVAAMIRKAKGNAEMTRAITRPMAVILSKSELL